MLRPLVSHFTDWASIFSACRCLMDLFTDTDIIAVHYQLSYPTTTPKELSKVRPTESLSDNKVNHVKVPPKKETPTKPTIPDDCPLISPVPQPKSTCPNCPKSNDGHLLGKCIKMCFNKGCRDEEVHLARTCDRWRSQLKANSARIMINDPNVEPWDQDIADMLGLVHPSVIKQIQTNYRLSNYEENAEDND